MLNERARAGLGYAAQVLLTALAVIGFVTTLGVLLLVLMGGELRINRTPKAEPVVEPEDTIDTSCRPRKLHFC